MKILTNDNEASSSTKSKHTYKPFDEAFKLKVKEHIQTMFINEQLVDYISIKLSVIAPTEKPAFLNWMRKTVIQTLRKPDPDWYQANKDEVEDYLAHIADRQAFFEPVRWIDAELVYLVNTTNLLITKEVEVKTETNQQAQELINRELIKASDAMRLLGVSKSTLERRKAEGMPFYKWGKGIYFDPKEITTWIKKESA